MDRRPGGHPRLTVGGRSVELDPGDIDDFRGIAIDGRYDDGGGGADGVHRVRRHNRTENRTLVALRGVPGRYIDEDGRPIASPDDTDGEAYFAEYDLVVDEGSGDFGDEPSVRVRYRDIDPNNRSSIYRALLDASAAARVDGGAGPIDVFVPKPGRVGFRMKGDDGKPVEIEFNAKDVRGISAAIEQAQEEPGTVTIDTAAGPVEVMYTESGSLIVSPPSGGPWGLAASGPGVADLVSAITANGEAAGIFR